jgi:hypothetical protein
MSTKTETPTLHFKGDVRSLDDTYPFGPTMDGRWYLAEAVEYDEEADRTTVYLRQPGAGELAPHVERWETQWRLTSEHPAFFPKAV